MHHAAREHRTPAACLCSFCQTFSAAFFANSTGGRKRCDRQTSLPLGEEAADAMKKRKKSRDDAVVADVLDRSQRGIFRIGSRSSYASSAKKPRGGSFPATARSLPLPVLLLIQFCARALSCCRATGIFCHRPSAMAATARITSDQLSSPRYQGQAVRAVGKLMAVDTNTVQLQLAGPEGARMLPSTSSTFSSRR